MRVFTEREVKSIKNTLRLCSNMINAPKRDSCLARDIMLCWNIVNDVLNNVDSNITSKIVLCIE